MSFVTLYISHSSNTTSCSPSFRRRFVKHWERFNVRLSSFIRHSLVNLSVRETCQDMHLTLSTFSFIRVSLFAYVWVLHPAVNINHNRFSPPHNLQHLKLNQTKQNRRYQGSRLIFKSVPVGCANTFVVYMCFLLFLTACIYFCVYVWVCTFTLRFVYECTFPIDFMTLRGCHQSSRHLLLGFN